VLDVGGEAAIVVTKRPATMMYHKGDWVFPGGRVDPAADASSLDTALREAEEELRLPRRQVEVVGQLDSHGPFPTGFTLDVYVGVVDAGIAPDPHPGEVAAMAVVPLSTFMSPGRYRRGGTPPTHDPGPLAATPIVPRRAARAPTAMHYFAVRQDEPDELLWGTQGEILYALLSHLVDFRSGRSV
jgi:ADP-ribose pyrophosphatase YjhB (NUDIX family)